MNKELVMFKVIGKVKDRELADFERLAATASFPGVKILKGKGYSTGLIYIFKSILTLSKSYMFYIIIYIIEKQWILLQITYIHH